MSEDLPHPCFPAERSPYGRFISRCRRCPRASVRRSVWLTGWRAQRTRLPISELVPARTTLEPAPSPAGAGCWRARRAEHRTSAATWPGNTGQTPSLVLLERCEEALAILSRLKPGDQTPTFAKRWRSVTSATGAGFAAVCGGGGVADIVALASAEELDEITPIGSRVAWVNSGPRCAAPICFPRRPWMMDGC